MKRIEAALAKQKEASHEASNERKFEIDLPNARATMQARKGAAKNDSAQQYEDISDFMANLSERSSGIISPETIDASTDQADGFADADNDDDNNNDEQPSVGTPPEVYGIDMDDWEMFGEAQYQGIHAKFKHMFDENEYKPQFNPFYYLLTNPPTNINQVEEVVELIFFGLELGSTEVLLDTVVTFLAPHLKQHPKLMEHLHMHSKSFYHSFPLLHF